MPGYLHGEGKQRTGTWGRFICQAHVSISLTTDADKMDEIQEAIVENCLNR